MTSLHVKSVIDQLWRLGEENEPPRVYALLDAAKDESIYPKVVNSDLQSTCLYQGEKARELAWVAPYLVELHRDDPFTEWVVENGWGKSWGIFAGSPATLNELKRHFRTFLMVYDEEGSSLYFRYYDPRVLRVYLPTCNAEELGIVFGPIRSFFLEGEEMTTALRFGNASGFLRQEELALT